MEEGIWVIMLAAITILGLLFTVNLFGKTQEVAQDLTDYHICRDGNIGVVNTRFQVFDWVVAERGVKHCKTEQATVKKGKEYETIAKKMALCWDEYLNGKENVFGTQDAKYCAFCSVLGFEDKNKQLNGLTKYLIETNYQPAGKSYMEYLAGVQMEKDQATFLENLELNNLKIDTSKKLAVMFVMYKDAYPGWLNQPRTKTTFVGGAAGLGTGIALGLYTFGGAALCLNPIGFIGCLASIAFVTVGTGVGASGGYLIGSDRAADWRARILVTEYSKDKLSQLKCTQLEGEDYLKLPQKT